MPEYALLERHNNGPVNRQLTVIDASVADLNVSTGPTGFINGTVTISSGPLSAATVNVPDPKDTSNPQFFKSTTTDANGTTPSKS